MPLFTAQLTDWLLGGLLAIIVIGFIVGAIASARRNRAMENAPPGPAGPRGTQGETGTPGTTDPADHAPYPPFPPV